MATDYLKQNFNYLISKYDFKVILAKEPTNDIFHHGYLVYKLEKEHIQITILREEYLWYISFTVANTKEYSMQAILKKLGVSPKRHLVIDRVWQGNNIENIARDLQIYIEPILEFINVEYLKILKRKRKTKS